MWRQQRFNCLDVYTVYCSKEVAHVAHVADEHLNMESEIQITCQILKLFFRQKVVSSINKIGLRPVSRSAQELDMKLALYCTNISFDHKSFHSR